MVSVTLVEDIPSTVLYAYITICKQLHSFTMVGRDLQNMLLNLFWAIVSFITYYSQNYSLKFTEVIPEYSRIHCISSATIEAITSKHN